MYGDTTAIRRRAAELRERAEEIRAVADRLVARTDAIGWLGQAGDALRERVRERAVALRRSASRHEDAADALDRHAREVDHLKHLIAVIERRARRLLDAAEGWAATWLRHFDPPAPGHLGWLHVEVPGL
jgi:uncharacterized protein YukE